MCLFTLKSIVKPFQMEKWTFGKVNAENYLWVELHHNGSMQLWNSKVKSQPMFSWQDPEPFPVNFFTVRTDESENAQVTATNYGKGGCTLASSGDFVTLRVLNYDPTLSYVTVAGQVLSMSKNVNVAAITSPAFSVLSRKLCVSFVYFTNRSTTPTVLTISSSLQTVHLGELNNNQVTNTELARICPHYFIRTLVFLLILLIIK